MFESNVWFVKLNEMKRYALRSTKQMHWFKGKICRFCLQLNINIKWKCMRCTYLTIECFDNFNFAGFRVDGKIVWSNQTKSYFTTFWIISFQCINNPSDWCGFRECQVIHILSEYGRQIATTWKCIILKMDAIKYLMRKLIHYWTQRVCTFIYFIKNQIAKICTNIWVARSECNNSSCVCSCLSSRVVWTCIDLFSCILITKHFILNHQRACLDRRSCCCKYLM